MLRRLIRFLGDENGTWPGNSPDLSPIEDLWALSGAQQDGADDLREDPHSECPSGAATDQDKDLWQSDV